MVVEKVVKGIWSVIDMTIDEAIAHEKIDSEPCSILCTYTTNRNDCIECRAYHKQLAEWLEELKSYRASVFSGDMTQKMLKEEYNKAIDDLLEDANEMAIEVDADTYTMKAIGIGLLENIAEQLKAGGKNEYRSRKVCRLSN